MPDNDTGERTEAPTTKRKSDARKDGNVAQSQEVTNALSLLFIILVFFLGGQWLFEKLSNMLKASLTELNFELTTQNMVLLFEVAFGRFLIILMPIALVMMLIGVIGTLVQIGFLFTTKPLKPKPETLQKMINPIAGLKTLVSPEAFQNLIKSLVKIGILSIVTYLTMKDEVLAIMSYSQLSVGQIFSNSVSLVMGLLFNCFLLYLFIAVGDLLFTRHRHTTKLKMSKAEIKDEFRQLEGDPNIRQKLRSLMTQMSRQRMTKDAEEADVVITNPIHLAVALKYDQEVNSAPIVVAKGKRKFAQKIKEIAYANDIKVVENVMLARALYKTCEVGSPISVELYGAVAEILAKIYQEKN